MKIALFGKMRTGKDTVADLLINDHDFKKYSLATGIGEIIYKYFPNAWDNGKPRHHYQHIGQQLRELDKNVWINYLLSSVERDGVERVVVADGRQVNEADALRKEGYLIVLVKTEEETRIKRILESGDNFNPEQLNHETEQQVDKITPDVVIRNDGTLEDLKSAVDCVLRVYFS